jgi:ABC-type molybdate transport system substrate-binding protein
MRTSKRLGYVLRRCGVLVGLALAGGVVMAQQSPVPVFAAGSLRGPLTEAAKAFEADAGGAPVALAFGASGLLLDRIKTGADAQVFASANMAHPQALSAAGSFGPTQVFTRNALCALVRPGLAVDSTNLVATLLRSDVKLGTSTPKADPSGDYAFEMFQRIEGTGAAPAGSGTALAAKALQLTGGPTSPPPPADRNVYGVLVASGQADVFITYCTNAVVARREQPQLQVVDIAPAINVAADYGLAVRKDASPAAQAFAAYLLSPAEQAILRKAGFGAL